MKIVILEIADKIWSNIEQPVAEDGYGQPPKETWKFGFTYKCAFNVEDFSSVEEEFDESDKLTGIRFRLKDGNTHYSPLSFDEFLKLINSTK